MTTRVPRAPRAEYRVSWKREGLRRKSRRFVTLAAAEKHAKVLATGDLHYRCDEGHGYLPGDGEFYRTCMPPVEDGPRIDSRAIGEWIAVSP